MRDILQNVRFTFRQLVKSPGFTAVAVLSLGLGIGAGVAVFSLVNAILLRSLPVPNPQELRVLKWTGTDVRMTSYAGGAGQEGNRWVDADSVSPPTFFKLREQGAGQADIFGFSPLDDVIARARGEAFAASGTIVSDNFFSGVGVRPLVGRLLAPGEDYSGAMNVVISHELWEKQFALDPAALGQTLTLNRVGFTVVGVLPRGINGVQPGHPSEFYVPLSAASPFLYRPINETFHWFVRLMARLKPGASDGQLRAALDVAFVQEVGSIMKEPAILTEPGRGGMTADRNQYWRPLLMLLGVVGLVTLVACANLAGLSLARGAARQHELAVRAALGANRRRLVLQSLTESLALAMLGSGLGVVLAIWGRSVIAGLLAGSAGDLRYDLSLDYIVLAFTLAVTLLTGLLSGVLPALWASRVDPVGGLRSRSSLGRPRLRAGKVLIVAQVCLSLLLVTGAVLYARTLVNLTRIDAGFDTEKLLLVGLNVRGSGYANDRPAEFYSRAQASLASIPGVRAATFIEFPLLSWGGSTGNFERISGRPVNAGTTRRLRVGETFFGTLGVPILRGRGFTAADDASAPKAIVVNEAFVRDYLPKDNPLGLTIRMWEADWQIVGVCRDLKYGGLREPVMPTTYFPFSQMFYSRFRTTHLRTPYFAVRTALDPMAVVSGVRKAVGDIDSGVAITEVTTQEDVLDRGVSRERLFASLCGALAVLAVLLACIGLYGLLAYNLTRRTADIGVRMALGATRRRILWQVLRQALLLSVVGVILGVPASLALTHLIETQLFGVKPNDPFSLAGAAVSLIAVALLAAWIPAHRAAKVDPIAALRSE